MLALFAVTGDSFRACHGFDCPLNDFDHRHPLLSPPHLHLPGKDSTGLVAGHAYTLVSAKESSKGDRLVKLRNPWGSMEWTGDWSDTSPLWTEEMQVRTAVLWWWLIAVVGVGLVVGKCRGRWAVWRWLSGRCGCIQLSEKVTS